MTASLILLRKFPYFFLPACFWELKEQDINDWGYKYAAPTLCLIFRQAILELGTVQLDYDFPQLKNLDEALREDEN